MTEMLLARADNIQVLKEPLGVSAPGLGERNAEVGVSVKEKPRLLSLLATPLSQL